MIYVVFNTPAASRCKSLESVYTPPHQSSIILPHNTQTHRIFFKVDQVIEKRHTALSASSASWELDRVSSPLSNNCFYHHIHLCFKRKEKNFSLVTRNVLKLWILHENGIKRYHIFPLRAISCQKYKFLLIWLIFILRCAFQTQWEFTSLRNNQQLPSSVLCCNVSLPLANHYFLENEISGTVSVGRIKTKSCLIIN